MEQYQNFNKNIKDDTINFKSHFFAIIRLWYLFPISILLFIILGYLYNIKSERKYKATSTILIRKDSKRTSRSNDMIKGFGLFDDQKSVVNEVAILSSYFLSESTIKQNNRFVSYYIKNQLRKDNIYKNSPFIVVMDSLHPQLIGNYKINFISDGSIKLKIDGGEKPIYDFSKYKEIGLIEYKSIEKNIKFDEWFETKYSKFKILKNINFNEDVFEETYYINISDLASLSINLQNSIIAEQYKKDADVIRLSIICDNPDEAKDNLNEFINRYSFDNLSEKNRIASLTINFIDEQLGVLSDSLHKNENRLEVFRRNNNVINIQIQSFNVLEKVKKVDSDMALAQLSLKYFNYLNEYIKTHNEFNDIVAPSIIGVNDQILNNQINNLLALGSERNKLLMNSTSENPLIININKQITNSKRAISESVKSLVNSTNIKINDLDKQIALFDKELQKIPETERSLIGIQRNFNIHNDIYTLLLQKRAESAIAQASNMPDSRIIDTAMVSTKPISPNKMMIYFISLILGLFIPLVYIISKKYIFDYFEDKKDISSTTNIPLIGCISHSPYNEISLVYNYPKSPISEAFRAIRTKLEFMVSESNSSIVLVTSSVPNEGKTFISVNIASTYALTGKKTVIVGLDLRNPGIYSDFELKNDIGVSTYLSGKSDIEKSVFKTKMDNLFVMPAGPIPPNPSELILRNRMVQLIDELKITFDYIIIDTPPIMFTTDAVLLFKYADVILYTVRANLTRKRMLSEITDLYNNKNVSNVGIIMNDVKNIDSYGYGYGYGYGYSYGVNKKQSKFNKIIKKYL